MPVKTLCIGLTGGIASGKSAVSDYFKALGVPIIDADVIAHQLTHPGAIAYEKIVAHFGKNILKRDQCIDRQKLRDIIFNDSTERRFLENLLHPLIRRAMCNTIATLKAPYCICVIPLLAKSSPIDFIDRVLVVDAPPAQQIMRAKKRDGATHDAIAKIIDAQADAAARLAIADDVIVNNSDLHALAQQVKQLHAQYLALARQ
jgi:dephospho-CoA kinase